MNDNNNNINIRKTTKSKQQINVYRDGRVV